MWQPEPPDGRRRLNLFRVARLIECDIGFLPTLRPSSWYPTAERRGKFKTRHASTILHPFPLYSWIDLKRESRLAFTSELSVWTKMLQRALVDLFTLCFDTKEITDSELFMNFELSFSKWFFSQINSIFVERQRINCILMQQDLNHCADNTWSMYIWCISHMLVYKWLCAALITAVMYAIDIEHCQIWLPMTRWMHNWMQYRWIVQTRDRWWPTM